MAERINPRTRRVRDALVNATIELLEEHPASELTVTQVAAKAGVSRPTIYKQFNDIATLIEECALNYTSEALSEAEEKAQATDDLEYIQEVMDVFINKIYEKRAFCKNAIFGPSGMRITSNLISMIEEHLSKKMKGENLSPHGHRLGRLSHRPVCCRHVAVREMVAERFYR